MLYLFLYQIKRYIYIYRKDLILYIKTKIHNYKNKTPFYQKKGIPNFNKKIDIKLKQKTFTFNSILGDLNKPFYLNSPLFIIINKHKKEILKNLIHIFENNFDFKLNIAVELEFYLKDKTKINYLEKKNIKVENEKGKNQFEIKTKTYTNINEFLENYLYIISQLNNVNAILDPIPYINDCGSALQINFSLIDNKNNNLFARIKKDKEYIESPLLLNCLSGLLKNINQNLLLYINSKNIKSLYRFDLKRNQKLKEQKKYPAPTFISWGINNRSTAIRIPTPPNITDIKKYQEYDNKHRRIEYRIPNSDADIYLTLIGILSSIIEGLNNDLTPHIEKTSFDVLYKNDNLEKIETNYYKLNDIFNINENVLFF